MTTDLLHLSLASASESAPSTLHYLIALALASDIAAPDYLRGACDFYIFRLSDFRTYGEPTLN